MPIKLYKCDGYKTAFDDDFEYVEKFTSYKEAADWIVSVSRLAANLLIAPNPVDVSKHNPTPSLEPYQLWMGESRHLVVK